MQTLTEIRQLLDERGLRPKHRLGQNFLHDKNQLIKLLDAAEVKPGDVVLEVGPGTGTLTSALLERGAEVIACEIDEDMAGIIEDAFAEAMADRANPPRGRGSSLTLIKGDALQKDRRLNSEVFSAIDAREFKLVANLPYQIASPLMTTLLIDHAPMRTGEAREPRVATCAGQFVTIQREVADRLMAKPASKAYGPLTIIVQAMAVVKRIGTLSPSCFWPPPEVTSAMVAIIPKATFGIQPSVLGEKSRAERRHSDFNSEERRQFARFIVELFTKRRKQLGSIFGRDRTDWPQGVTSELRPEALTIEQLTELWIMQQQ